jgi:hypothetical protein
MQASTYRIGTAKKRGMQYPTYINKVQNFGILFCLTSHSDCITISHENATRQNRKKNLEENSLSMPTDSAADSLGSGKCWVRSYILQDLRSLTSSVVHLVPIDTVIVRDLLNRTRNSTVNL